MSFSAVLARVELSDVSRHSQSTTDTSSYLDLILCVAAIVVSLAAVIYCWNRFRDKVLPRSDSPESLFLELCRVHRLTRSEKSLLMRAVAMAGLNAPAVAFVHPGVLGLLAESPEATALAEKLFGGSE